MPQQALYSAKSEMIPGIVTKFNTALVLSRDSLDLRGSYVWLWFSNKAIIGRITLSSRKDRSFIKPRVPRVRQTKVWYAELLRIISHGS